MSQEEGKILCHAMVISAARSVQEQLTESVGTTVNFDFSGIPDFESRREYTIAFFRRALGQNYVIREDAFPGLLLVFPRASVLLNPPPDHSSDVPRDNASA